MVEDIKVVVDTGASNSLISYRVLKGFPQSDRLSMEISKLESCTIANNQVCEILGDKQIPLYITGIRSGKGCQYQATFQMVKELHPPMTLGTNLFAKHTTQVDFGTTQVDFGARLLKLIPRARGSVQKYVEIPPYSQATFCVDVISSIS